MVKVNFNIRTTVICSLLCLLFFRLSFWQWERHLQKISLVKELKEKIVAPPVEIGSINWSEENWKSQIYRRVKVTGSYDFDHEFIVKNRRFNGLAGVIVITPLKIKDSSNTILVNRGFIPLELSHRGKRESYQLTKDVDITGILKESAYKKIFAPSDASNQNGVWVDAWLRVEIPQLQKQFPYKLLPAYLEEISTDTPAAKIADELINYTSERSEMFSLAASRAVPTLDSIKEYKLPVPLPEKYSSPVRHIEYVWEWAIMGIGTIIIGLILQLKRI